MSGVSIEELKDVFRDYFGQIKEDIDSIKKENLELKKRVIELESVKKDKLKEEFLRKFERKKREIIKQKILELSQQGFSIPEIKDIIVDRENYCSKATFYRYIEKLGTIKVNNKILIKKD